MVIACVLTSNHCASADRRASPPSTMRDQPQRGSGRYVPGADGAGGHDVALLPFDRRALLQRGSKAKRPTGRDMVLFIADPVKLHQERRSGPTLRERWDQT